MNAEQNEQPQALQRINSAPPAPMFGGVNIESLLEKAVDAKSAVDVLERLAVMRREMRAEAAKEAFDNAMAALQAECPVIRKDSVVNDKNNRPRYRYAPLDSIVAQVKELVQAHGFSYRVTAKVDSETINRTGNNGENYQVQGGWVTAICTVTHSAGHSEPSEFKVPIDPEAYMNQAQKFASALTFAKRYAFCNAFGILTGDQDDDAQGSDPEYAAGQGKRAEYRRHSPPATTTKPTPPPAAAAPAAAAATATAPTAGLFRYPTEATRTWAIRELTMGSDGEAKRKLVTEFLIKAGCILATETLENWPFQYVPSSKADLAKLMNSIGDFENGLAAKIPFHHGPEPATAAPAAAAAAAAPAPAARARAASKATAKDKANAIEVPRVPDTGDQSAAPVRIDPQWERTVGKIERVTVKTGTNGRGAWTCYGIKIGEDWYNTFSNRVGALAQKNEGREVDLYFTEGERGSTAEHIEG